MTWRTVGTTDGTGRAPARRLAAMALAGVLALGACSSSPGSTAPASNTPGSTASPSAAGTGAASSASASGDAPATAADDVSWVQVAKDVAPKVVAISVQSSQGASAGSGVVLDAKGQVVTNHHVISSVARGGKILVTLWDERVLDATVVGSDPASDLALLQVTDPPADLQAIDVASSDELVVGAPVMAVGNPLGLAGTVTTGIVSALNRPVTAGSGSRSTGGGEPVVTNAIQTSAAVNPGNSGGALVDAQGRLVGINSSIATLGQGSGNIGISFAITTDQMRSVVEQLAADGRVQHSYLGVGTADAVVQVDGSRRWAAGITQVAPGTAGAKAGLQVRDGVTAIDGEPVDSALSLIAQIRERPVGEQVTLTVAREGRSQDVKVTLGARPS